MTTPTPSVVHLRAAGTSVVLDLAAAAPAGPQPLPAVLHWGADLGELTSAELATLVDTTVPATVSDVLDVPVRVGVLPEHSAGWVGRPGVSGSRAGRNWTPRFTRSATEVRYGPGGVGGRVVVTGQDCAAGLEVALELELLAAGLLRQRARLIATRPATDGAPFELAGLRLALPVPPVAVELFDMAGRWGREREPQRLPFVIGIHSRENRRGRTGADAPLVLAAGRSGFGLRHGEVWAVHVAWSGNHCTYAERLCEGPAVLGGGELLLPGEVRLTPGRSYRSPWLYAAHATDGLDAVAARFHAHLRTRPHHPRTPRAVVLNTWEAVYFDHDLDRLVELARHAAEVGVERYVLDDGWFRGRRDATAGLGDWTVDDLLWPRGLHPLTDVVTGLGMQFGLWVEPEMVSPDSDLARAHPDWLLGPGGGRHALPFRHQQVLDLTQPGAYAHVLAQLSALLAEYPISYLKWDHNRDLLEAGHGQHGVPAVAEQTRATYRLLDELRVAHAYLEIESCSAGGLRVDLEILEHTDRVWGSDNLDPLERQQIQRWTTQLLPPELIGSHVAGPRSHSTGRVHDLAFRAGTALFASFGIEWDLTATTPAERRELAAWVALYRDRRALLHSGAVLRADPTDPSTALHGVVATDRSAALYALVALATPSIATPEALRLPGLDPDRRYRVRSQPPGDRPRMRGSVPPWLIDGVVLPGRVLDRVGLRSPALMPEQLLLLSAEAV